MNTAEVHEAVELRLEWYQVRYNLAAHRAHLTETRVGPTFGTNGIPKDTLADPVRGARSLILTAGATLTQLEQEVRKRDEASGGRGRWLGPRRWRSRTGDQSPTRNVDARDRNVLITFLGQTIEPAAAVLLAGLLNRALSPGDSSEVDPVPLAVLPVTRGDVAEIARRSAPEPSDSERLVGFAGQGRPSYRVRYNLACYSSAQMRLYPRRADELAYRSLAELARSLRDAPSIEAPRLAAWAGQDPTLGLVRSRHEEDFKRIVLRYQLPTG